MISEKYGEYGNDKIYIQGTSDHYDMQVHSDRMFLGCRFLLICVRALNNIYISNFYF